MASCGGLQRAERGSKPSKTNSRRQFDFLSRRNNNKNCRSHNVKSIMDSVLSTALEKIMCIDIKNFYLCAPMDRYEYMHMPLDVFLQHVIEQYDLARKAKNGKVYLEIRRSIYDLPQSRKLANDLLKKKLAPGGYYEVPHTPGLWNHISQPVSFTLVVDNFGVKYVGEENIQHLIQSLKKTSQSRKTGLEHCIMESH